MPIVILKKSGISLSYREQGVARSTLVLLHGSNQSLETFSLQLASQLLSDYRIISLDLPGHGQSSSAPDMSMLGLSRIVSEFVHQLVTGPFILVGFSLGGHIALGLIENGLKPKGLVIVATPPAAKPIDMNTMFQIAGPMALLYKKNITVVEAMALAQAFYSTEASVDQEVQDIQKVDPVFREQFPLTLMRGEHIDEQKLMRKLELPVFIATAQHDMFVKNEHILQYLPKGSIHKNYSAGHNLHREAAAQFNTDLATFATNVFEERPSCK